MEISSIDAAICLVYLIAMVVMGLWIGRDQRDLSGYLLGGRDLPWWAILGSIVATETSTATFLSVPGLAFAANGDMRFLQLTFGYIIGRCIVAVVLVPLYFRGEMYTAYEVLEQRFGGGVKRASSLLFLVTRNLGDGLRLFLAGLALEKVLGLELNACIIVIGIATILYTYFGGMKAVIWSDCLQLVIYMTGGVVALILLVGNFPDGWRELWAFGEQTGRFRWFDSGFNSQPITVFTDPFNIWAGLLGGAMLTLGTHGTDQMFVQRYLSSRNRRDASMAVVASGLVVFLQFCLFLLLGVALACFYDHIQPQSFDHNDEVFAAFIVDYLPVGLVGLTLAAVFAAAMSTLSSSLNSSAAAAVSDFYQPWLTRQGGEVSSKHLVNVSRGFTAMFGLIQIIVGIAASQLSRSVVNDALAIAGFTAGILLGVFGLGILTRRANQRGVLMGFVAGIAFLTWIKFGTPIAWPWHAIIGSAVTFAVGYACSRWISPSTSESDSNSSVNENEHD